MKAIVGLVVIAGAVLAIYYAAGTADRMVDPTEQGKEKRAIIETCASWTEVLDRAGAPRLRGQVRPARSSPGRGASDALLERRSARLTPGPGPRMGAPLPNATDPAP